MPSDPLRPGRVSPAAPSASPEDPKRRPLRPAFSVRVRILASLVAIAAAGLVLAGGVSYLVQRDRQLADVDSRLTASVEAARFVLTDEPSKERGGALVARSDGEAITSTEGAVEAVLARVLPAPFQSSLGLVDGQPAFVPSAQVPFALQDYQPLLDAASSATAGGSVARGTYETPEGPIRWIAAPVTVAGDSQTGTYITAFSLNGELSALRSAFLTYAVVALIALVAIAATGWFVAGRLLAPIRTLRETTARITASDLSERIPVTGRDDVSELTSTVNDMLDRLEKALSSQRRLLDDVRHELNTPITIVRGHLELVDTESPADVAATRALAIDELDRMATLVTDIAELSASEREPSLRAVDVADLTGDVFAKAVAIPGPEWRLAPTAATVADLDPQRITQAWLQLCDNAAKYSPPGSPVTIGSEVAGGSVELWVSDSGPGIDAASLPKIFERFGRAADGRGVAGSGLGLAIARAIARGHGGDISVETSPAGSRFTIVLPVTAERAPRARSVEGAV